MREERVGEKRHRELRETGFMQGGRPRVEAACIQLWMLS